MGHHDIMNPPGHPRLAYDFLAVDGGKNPYKGTSLSRHVFSSIAVQDTLAWGMPVYAVQDGTVIAAHDGAPDRHRLSMALDLVRLLLFGPKVAQPFSNLGGNHVILQCGSFFPLYAHLMKGSVQVRVGDTVCTGQMLGSVGNSGSSLQPHLHFQVMSTPDPFPLFQNLLPVALEQAEVKRRDAWRQVRGYALKSGEQLRLQPREAQPRTKAGALRPL